MELGKIPSNCKFLQPKKTNGEIWSVIPPSSRSRDRGVQDIQTIAAASVSLILQAASDMSQYLVVAAKGTGGKIEIMFPLTKTKDVLSLAGKANQKFNQFRWNMIKSYLLPQFAKLADISDYYKIFLFGDLIADRVESLRKENQTKSLLRNKTNLKRKHPQNQQEPSNYQSSSKTQKRNSGQGQKDRRSAKSYSRQQTQETTQNKQHQQFRHKSTHQHTNTPVYCRKDSKHHKRKYLPPLNKHCR